MNDSNVTVTGMVLSTMPIGENDKRIILLTRERGKITAFARGARRPNSSMLAATEPFAFGEFTLFEGKSSYNVLKTDISHYFREIALDPDAAMLGFYFLELSDFYSWENLDGTDQLSLLFYSLKALLSDAFSNRLVRRVFELKTLALSGEYPDPDRYKLSQSAAYMMRYVITSEMRELYRFAVTDDVLNEVSRVIDNFFQAYVNHRFRSLAVFSEM